MRVTVNQPSGTQLFFTIEPSEEITVGDIAKLVEDEEGVPVQYQLFSNGKECWADHADKITSYIKDDSLTLDVSYDLHGQGGVRCETAKPALSCHVCCCEMSCVKKYDCFCCCCEAGCNLL